ncbi:RNA polymerase sigma factor RpoD/SigA [Flaviaesturariibacter aridisoli]|uniref:RNA polymerase sigma factor RpoD/SigA n=2 Tax=Flaviaesturariibacter aridisoli TaxID=2545761 RepID=A0A4R4E5V6_9BACT|nr:RNA polymerase sigma factor RpoD/SigA [Flaviaesturariibacter aridisoli]TCZ75044.1 RNA polymerase sigma factor RpoD/SigA [Flaviaesturariibacter aridisoli]
MRQIKIVKSITNRESPSLEKYLQEIARVELVTPEEEARLAARIRQGDAAALERLTKANLRFVVSVAKQYQNQGLSLPDLVNEGNVGLIRAAQRFDETKGFKFISYAVWWIRQSILQALAEQSRIVRLPLNKVGLTARVQRAVTQLEQEFERDPTAEEVAELLDMEIEEVRATLALNTRHLSTDSPVSEGEDGTLLDRFVNPNADSTDRTVAYRDSLRTEIRRTLQTLTERQQEVVCYFFGIGIAEPLSLDDIGLRFNLTRERVRQIKDKAIAKLQSTNKTTLLRGYLGA